MTISARPVLSQCLQLGSQLSACGKEHICSRYVAKKESRAQSPSTLLSSSKSRRLRSIHTRNAHVRRYAQASSTPETVCSRVTESIWRRVRGPPTVNTSIGHQPRARTILPLAPALSRKTRTGTGTDTGAQTHKDGAAPQPARRQSLGTTLPIPPSIGLSIGMPPLIPRTDPSCLSPSCLSPSCLSPPSRAPSPTVLPPTPPAVSRSALLVAYDSFAC